MAVVDVTAGLNDSNFQTHTPEYQTLSRVVNFAKISATGGTGLVANTYNVLTIPAGFLVEEVFWKWNTVSTTATAQYSIGDTTDAAYYVPLSTATSGSTSFSKVPSVATASKFKGSNATAATLMDLSTKLYTAADAIAIGMGTTPLLDGVLTIVVRGIKL